MPPDIEKYHRFVAHFDIPDAQKHELIHIVWRMMQSFTDRAFGDDSVQQCLELQANKNAISSEPVLSFKNSPHHR